MDLSLASFLIHALLGHLKRQRADFWIGIVGDSVSVVCVLDFTDWFGCCYVACVAVLVVTLREVCGFGRDCVRVDSVVP